MLFFLQIVFLALAAGMVFFLERVRQKTQLTFIVMMVTFFLSWVLTFVMRFLLPYEVVLARWGWLDEGFALTFAVNNVTWLLGVLFQTLLVLYVASYPSRHVTFETRRAIQLLLVAFVSVFVLYAGNVVSYLFGWSVLMVVFVIRKLRLKEKVFSWHFVGVFLLWGLLWWGSLSFAVDGFGWELVSGFSNGWVLGFVGLSAVLVLFPVFRDESISMISFFYRILLVLFLELPFLFVNHAALFLNRMMFWAIVLLVGMLVLSMRIILEDDRRRFVGLLIGLVHFLVLFFVVMGLADEVAIFVLMWMGVVGYVAITTIESRFILVLRGAFWLVVFVMPFLFGGLDVFWQERTGLSILFSVVYAVMMIALLRVLHGRKNAFREQKNWLTITLEDHEWYRVDEWAKIFHWFGVVFLFLMMTGLAIFLAPESLLDVGIGIAWQLFLSVGMTVGLLGLWRYRGGWLGWIEKLFALRLPRASFEWHGRLRESFIRVLEIPEEVLESPSGVFWTLLFVLFIVSLVMVGG